METFNINVKEFEDHKQKEEKQIKRIVKKRIKKNMWFEIICIIIICILLGI
jgi:t-SNARE complex subunit (syntaxin)